MISEVRARFLYELWARVPIEFMTHALRVTWKTFYIVSFRSLPFGGRERPAVRGVIRLTPLC